MSALSREVEELAGGVEDLRRVSQEASAACHRELRLLPSPTTLRERCGMQEEQPAAAVAVTLERLGLAAPKGYSKLLSTEDLSFRRPAPTSSQTSEADLCATVRPPLPSLPVVAGAVFASGHGPGSGPRTPSHTPIATAAELLVSLRHRMASRIQRAWRCFRARRELRYRAGHKVLFVFATCRQRRLLSIAFMALHRIAEDAACHAAVAIARNVRGWLGRRKAARRKKQEEAAAQSRHRATLQLLQTVSVAWAQWARGVQRWQRLWEMAADRPPPRGNFWQLVPTDGKTAVAQAQHNWALQRHVLIGWLRVMNTL